MEKQTFKDKCKCAFDKINVVKKICIHLLGPNQTIGHRMLVGCCIMGLGVFIVESTAHIAIVSYITNIAGFGIHGIGVTPFVEWAGGLSVDEDIVETKEIKE